MPIAPNPISLPLSALGCAVLLTASSARAVLVADNGFGTADMPLAADYVTLTPMQIVDGLPPADVINIDGVFKAPTSGAEVAGGGLGGTTYGGQNIFELDMTGSGSLSGFNRLINMPYSGNVGSVLALGNVGFEVHTTPRTAFAPLQYFTTDMFRLFSQITGDPDFDLLRLVAGSDFGMPSPGATSLSQSGANWEAGSYFDLTYRIDFVGRPGGALSGMSGSTTRTVRIAVGAVIIPEPSGFALLGGLSGIALMRRRRRR